MKPWYRAYVGTVADPKLAEAALIAECAKSLVIAVWHGVLESASEEEREGAFATTPRRLAATLAEPVALIERVFASLTELLMIREGVIVAWAKRQREWEAPASAAERQRRSRENRRHGADADEPDLLTPVTPVTDGHRMSQDVTRPEREGEREDPPPPSPGADANVRGQRKPFAELTGSNVTLLHAADPLEAEARVILGAAAPAEKRDFRPIADLIAAGSATRGDVLGAAGDVAAKNFRPDNWGQVAPWVVAKAKDRIAAAMRKGGVRARAPPGAEEGDPMAGASTRMRALAQALRENSGDG